MVFLGVGLAEVGGFDWCSKMLSSGRYHKFSPKTEINSKSIISCNSIMTAYVKYNEFHDNLPLEVYMLHIQYVSAKK